VQRQLVAQAAAKGSLDVPPIHRDRQVTGGCAGPGVRFLFHTHPASVILLNLHLCSNGGQRTQRSICFTFRPQGLQVSAVHVDKETGNLST
jgi:hypothetical protein